MSRKLLFSLLLAGLALLATGCAGSGSSSTAENIDQDSRQALKTLYSTNPEAREIARQAKGILVFPKIIKAGLIVGGSYGEGELIVDSKVQGYYNTVSGTYGLQAGAQSYGYVLFLMNDKALDYLRKSSGWEIGVGPSVTVVNAGVAKKLSSTTLRDDAYAFIFSQQGLMAGLGLEGTKITPVER
ncbi:YSC84-related protein [Azotobacter bryophylli]|uniref:YSC84-related protein n=1 Tax=Azotobacter bryophylli TaxID=1986537 RepID=A0ABV7AT58_9GAMM